MPTLAKTIFELSRIFKCLKEIFYENELEQPLITIQTRGKRLYTLAWCTSRKIWKKTNDGDKAFYEINFTAEYLTRDTEDIIHIMVHEMAHLYAATKGIKDTTRAGTYHNKEYKKIAEEHGLSVEKDEKYGWTITQLTEAAREAVQSIKINKQAFKVYREGEQLTGKKKKKSSSRKYVCPDCGMTIRSTKNIDGKLICVDCAKLLVCEDEAEVCETSAEMQSA